MAEALVGEAFLSSFLSVLFNKIGQVLDFFKTRKLNDKLLNKLEITMTTVNGLLEDAEEKQITKPAVKKWVTQLKNAVYDADDLLDEIAYEALKLKVEAGSETRADQVQKFFSSINPFKKVFDFEPRLEEILERLENLVKQKGALGLKEGIGEKQLSQRTPTSSLGGESVVYGRDADREDVMKMVLQSESDDASGNQLVVIPIVGMGGLGKTTLAQLIYNDPRAQQQFGLRAWVCVSEENNPLKVTQHIHKAVTNSPCCDSMTPDQLHVQLKGKLEGQRFLLVLDDVWNADFWDYLQRPLKFGAQGSVILVTTRDKRVAEVMGTVLKGTVLAYCLKELDADASWFLFAKHAFTDENSDTRPDLEKVGKAIVKKCKGLPLAAKTLGGLLRCKRDVKEWEKILKSNLWDLPDDKIIAPLKLSYHYLPSHLKRCFAYCALFPKDYEFKKEELILLWIAESFLVQAEGDADIEEVGDQCFQDLVSRSFFSRYREGERYIMHDLIHDLAESVLENFYLRLENIHSSKISDYTRHLSSYEFVRWDIALYNAKTVRTVLLLSDRASIEVRNTLFSFVGWQIPTNKFELEMPNNLISILKQARVLYLSFYDNIEVIPDSIGEMKHLRYLNLSYTKIRILPESIQNLYNLQILILRDCRDLIELPANMKKLVNLFHLDIEGTRKVKEMPLQMSKLTKLQKLSYFIVGEQNGSRISELRELKHLRGGLQIRNLQKVTNPQDANLKDKIRLKELELEWNWDRDIDDTQHEKRVLEQLKPHTSMECLTIDGYGGTSFAGWVGDSSFSSMVSLTIKRCKNCFSLPPLGQLPSLKWLKISELHEVTVVDPDFYGSSKKPFPSLESLRFEKMPQWEEWIPFAEDDDVDEEEGGAFPVLQELFIKECPNLKNSLPSHLPFLKRLHIEECNDEIMTSLARAPQLFSLKTWNWPSLDYQMGQMALFSATLEEIEIRNCNSVKCFPLELFPKLKLLGIWGSRNLESLVGVENMHGNFTPPEPLQIKYLGLQNCSSLKSLPERMQSLLPFLENLMIRNCSEVEWFSKGGLPSKLESLDIVGCKKLIAGNIDNEWLQHLTNLTSLTIGGCSKLQCLSNQWNLQLLSSLSSFTIKDIDDVESFPEKTLLPSTLSVLVINYCKNLKSLDYEGLQHLTNLKCLSIDGCDKLQRLPEEGLPSSLGSLWIYRCPLLEQRCERDKGEDWPKIAYIPNVKFNGNSIN